MWHTVEQHEILVRDAGEARDQGSMTKMGGGVRCGPGCGSMTERVKKWTSTGEGWRVARRPLTCGKRGVGEWLEPSLVSTIQTDPWGRWGRGVVPGGRGERLVQGRLVCEWVW